MNNNKAIVLLSGGMDSLVTAAIAAKENSELYFLHASYGQLTQAKELHSFEQIATHYRAKDRKVIELSWLRNLGGSRLTDADFEATEETAAKSFPDTYVPFRNPNLICMAVSWAEVVGAECIYLGVVEDDSSGYPDCSKSFIQAMQKTIDVARGVSHPIQLRAPVIDMSKSEIISLGMKLRAPFELSWSCYFASDKACGKCDSCRLRLNAFAKAGYKDPITYQGANT